MSKQLVSNLIKIFLLFIGFYFSSVYLLNNTKLKHNILDAVQSSDPINKELFGWYQSEGVFKGKIFISYGPKISIKQQQDIRNKMRLANYGPVSSSLDFQNPSIIGSVIPYLSKDKLDHYFDSVDLKVAENNFLEALSMPGTGGSLKLMSSDPLLFGQFFINNFIQSPSEKSVSVEQFNRLGDQNLDSIVLLKENLKNYSENIHMIGEDLFAVDAYEAVKRDIFLCSVVSIVIAVFIFFIFCKSWILPVVLIIGTYSSIVFGVLTVNLYDSFIYAIVLGFVSTFIGFNNEYLIHLSGVTKDKVSKHITGLGSAIGTTLIGFIILLFTQSKITQQFGLISIGGMVGFIFLMMLFVGKLSQVRFRELSIPFILIKKRTLVVFFISICICLGSLIQSLKIETDIDSFKYTSKKLDISVTHFNKLSSYLKLKNPVAISTSGIQDEGFFVNYFNRTFQNTELQYNQSKVRVDLVDYFKKRYSSLSLKLYNRLLSKGIQIDKKPEIVTSLSAAPPVAFLKSISKVLKFPILYQSQKDTYIVSYNAELNDLPSTSIVLSPKKYYDTALSDIGINMVKVFCVGLLIMFLYLVPWQLNVFKLIYIYSPLVLSFASVFLILNITGESLNLIHIMGMVLVIALALDYSSITASADSSSEQFTKVLLSGLMSLASFGPLMLAEQPALFHLGIVVFTGTVVSLFFSIFVRCDYDS